MSRRFIRKAVQESLLGKTIAEENVQKSRPNPLSQRPTATEGEEDQELPMVVVYTKSTDSEIFEESPRLYRHRIELVVEGILEIRPDMDIDDSLDDFEGEIVRAVLRDDTLGGLANDTWLTGSIMGITDKASKYLGAVVVNFIVEFFSNLPDIDGADLDDLLTVKTDFNLAGEQATNDELAKTEINFTQGDDDA